jgi:hypothetical protein
MNTEENDILLGNAPGLRNLKDCGCCRGVGVQTPLEILNRPGLTAIAYRIGSHPRFKESMLARLSSLDRPGLAGLQTRDDDDFSIAFMDAWATVADVLTFYQERIANELFLRTATERRSILELARLIDYELRPGVAASTHLAFTLEDAPGAPRQTTIDVGTKVRSIPGPGEKAQTFETVERIEGRVEWNELRPRRWECKIPHYGSKEVFLKSVETGLKPGDPLLFIGKERRENPRSDQWDFRKIDTITINREVGYTKVTWKEGLGWRRYGRVILPAEKDFAVFAFRRRASVFGHNAPDWRAMPDSVKNGFSDETLTEADREWPRFEMDSDDTIHLDAVYTQIIQNSWIVLSVPDYEEVYEVVEIEEESCADFTLTAKTTRLKLRGENLREKFGDKRSSKTPNYGRRDIVVYAQSEALEMAEEPLFDPVYGDGIVLSRSAPELKPKQALSVSGKRARVRVAVTGQELVSADESRKAALEPGDLLRVMAPPAWFSGTKTEGLRPEQLADAPASSPPRQLRWHLMDKDGFKGFLLVFSDEIALQAAAEDDPTISEIALIADDKDAVSSDRDHTTIILRTPLVNVFDRSTVAINANVARATQGETVHEVLGSGDAGQLFQKFELKQPSLTHVSASTPRGTESTLKVRVNDILWHEASSFYGRSADTHVFITRTDDEGKTGIQFGDGLSGARLPTGQENLRATYRKGTGFEGNVKAEQLSTLLSRPLGVKSVSNPEDASGGDDPESLADARRNASLTVLTLDRAVSLRDYEDFSRAFAGIAKALATWVWDGEERCVFITVAGPKGVEIKENRDGTYKKLLEALQKAGDPRVKVRIKSYRRALFRIAARIKVDPDHQPEKVLGEVEQSLRTQFSFDARELGQPVILSEVIAVLQAVPGVEAGGIDQLYRTDGIGGAKSRFRHRAFALPTGKRLPWIPAQRVSSFLPADRPRAGEDGELLSAELLTLDSAVPEIGVMP